MSRFSGRIGMVALLCAPVVSPSASPLASGTIGINVLLAGPPDEAVLAELGTHGQVLDVIPEIHGVTLRAHESALQAIRALPSVVAAAVDSQLFSTSTPSFLAEDFAHGANQWSLDAINVTDFDAGRTVGFTGEGVYVAVIDTGLSFNWREYFPEERIASQFARAFGGGGGDQGTVSSLPEVWEHDTQGHGTMVTSILLGYRYHFAEPPLPSPFNGVAPAATVIPIKAINNNQSTWYWGSTMTRAVIYVANLKASGALNDAPVVINASWGGPSPDPLLEAAIDFAIANGVVFVAAAGDAGDGGIGYPCGYPQVISAAASGWNDELPADDPTLYEWNVRDVPEADASVFFLAPFNGLPLAGQDLDLAAPGSFVPVPVAVDGREDYSFFVGTSAACPFVAGVAALMLQKNAELTAAEIETILEVTALPLEPDCRDVRFGFLQHGNHQPTLGNGFANSTVVDLIACWEADMTGAGLLDAQAALAATPFP